MRLTKPPEPSHPHPHTTPHRCNRARRLTQILVRTSLDQRSSYPTLRSAERGQNDEDEAIAMYIPPQRESMLDHPDLGEDFGDQMRMLHTRRERINSWIAELDSGIQLARESELEDVPLTQIGRREQRGNVLHHPAVPIQSMMGSIHNASTAGTYSQRPLPAAIETVAPGVARAEVPSVVERWAARDVVIICCACLAQAVQMYPYGQGISTGVSLVAILDDSSLSGILANAAWIAASYPLSQGAFLLVGSRLGAKCGPRVVFVIACVWWIAFQIGSGFAPNAAVLCAFRGLAGIGGGCITPNVLAMMEMNLAPGKKRTLAVSMFAASTVVGFSLACLFSAILVQLTAWKWSFIFAALMGAAIFGLTVFIVPANQVAARTLSMDWVGAYLLITALVLFNFAWNQAPGVGWSTPYVYILLIVSIGHFIAFFLWEGRKASTPLLPSSIWRSSQFCRTIMSVTSCFLSLGVFLWYFSLYGLVVRGYPPISNGANYQPLTVLAVAVGFFSAWSGARMRPDRALVIGSTASLVANVLLATAPEDLTYWAMMFPAMIIASLSAGLVLPATHALTTSGVGHAEKTACTALLWTLLTSSFATAIGTAGTVDVYTEDGDFDAVTGYRNALYLGVALGGVGLIAALSIRMPKGTRGGWTTEMKEVQQSDSEQSSPVDEDPPQLGGNV